MLMDWLLQRTCRQTKINKIMLYRMHKMDLKEDNWTIHKLYQHKQMDLHVNCVICMHILFAIVHSFHLKFDKRRLMNSEVLFKITKGVIHQKTHRFNHRYKVLKHLWLWALPFCWLFIQELKNTQEDNRRAWTTTNSDRYTTILVWFFNGNTNDANEHKPNIQFSHAHYLWGILLGQITMQMAIA